MAGIGAVRRYAPAVASTETGRPDVSVRYATVDDFPGWDRAPELLLGIIAAERPATVLEVGSGASPTLAPDELAAAGIRRYTTNDASADELAKAPDGYDTLCAHLDDPGWRADEPYDLIFSRMVNEHVEDGRTYFANLYDALTPNGLTVHCFSTLYALPFLFNRLAPDVLSSRVLDRVAPGDHHDKFRAYYSWSRGPTTRNIERFESIGFVVEEYVGYFGHRYYRRLPPVDRFERRLSATLSRHPVPHLTSYALVRLRRPPD